MEAAEGMRTTIKELKKVQAEKTKRVREAVKEIQQSRHTQTEQPPRSQ